MTFRVKMGKYLVQNLFYPAVLGSFLFTIIQSIADKIRNPNSNNFLSNSNELLWIQLLLAISLIIFYCCDYLYSYVTKNYKAKYFIIDTVAIVLLIISFFGLNLNSIKEPKPEYVVLPFIVFLAFFFIWDFTLVRMIPKNTDGIEKRRRLFFKRLCYWQIIALLILGFSYIMNKCKIINLDFLLIIYILILLSSAIFYFWNINEKKEITEKNIK